MMPESIIGDLYLHVECFCNGTWIPVGVALLEPDFEHSKEADTLMDEKLYHYARHDFISSGFVANVKYSVSYRPAGWPVPEGRPMDLEELYSPQAFYTA